MPILVNLRHLDAHDVHLAGQLPADELDIELRDDIVQLAGPLEYNLEVQKLEDGLLAQGSLSLPLMCHCVRCLKRFDQRLELSSWTAHLPLVGEDAVAVDGDCVDLTPDAREDILLEFPQHPLCDPECQGLPKAKTGKPRNASSQSREGSPAWEKLNKLKF